MSRYRKIDPRFWKDEKVNRLSRDEKLIALYLFTGQSNRIGIFSFSPGEAIEDLGIPIETFREGFMEPFGNVCRTLNFGWDETFRVLYLPTWWKYNCPENPNVLKACLADLHEVPQTSLIKEFSENLLYLPQTFHQTFREGLGKPSPQRMPHQEQEQKQDNKERGAKAPDLSSSIPKKKKRTRPASGLNQGFERFYSVYPKHEGRRAAERAWTKIDPDECLTDKIVTAVQNQKRWRTILAENPKTFIPEWPNPASWLNGARWEDEQPANLAGNSNGHAKPPEVKDLGDGMVEVDGRPMDRKTFERRYGQATA